VSRITTPLPRSLDPLPWESLAGYLLRLSFRLDLPAGHVASLTGLTPGHASASKIPASRMLIMDEATTRAFARAARLSTGEATALTLAGLASRYPPLSLSYLGRNRQPTGIFTKEPWILARSTRYCPQCLAGDPASPAQLRYGGLWNKLWRLPVVFACPRHQRLLEHACQACGQLTHQRVPRPGLTSLVPLPAHHAMHPAACRHPLPAPGNAGRRHLRPCGHQLARPAPGPAGQAAGLQQMLQFQRHLLSLLNPDGPQATLSGGEPATPGQYFTDLRILACLITASWPAARDLPLRPWQGDLTGQHADAVRGQIEATRDVRLHYRQISFYDTPPLEAASSAALLTLAGDILAIARPGSLGQIISHLTGPKTTDAVRFLQRWVKWFLPGEGYCSPALRAAAAPAVGAPHIIKQTTGRVSPRKLTPRPRLMTRYTISHIPAHLLDDWYHQHFAQFTSLISPRLLRRAAALHLARTCTPASWPRLGELLGIPVNSTENAIIAARRQLAASGQRPQFDAAIGTLAGMLDGTGTRTDYGRRRHALRAWSISPDRWNQLITDLPGSCHPLAGWGTGKRLLASVWVWARLTGGEHLFAPATRPDLTAPGHQRPGGAGPRSLVNYVNLRWPFIADPAHGSHYTALRQRLDTYADHLAASIDNDTSDTT